MIKFLYGNDLRGGVDYLVQTRCDGVQLVCYSTKNDQVYTSCWEHYWDSSEVIAYYEVSVGNE